MIKLIFTDVDDTLISKELTDTTKDAIKKVTNSGIEFIMCSGRPTSSLIMLANELNDYGAKIKYVSGFNGAEIIDVKQNKSLFKNGFSEDEVLTITNLLVNLEIDFGLYTSQNLLTNNLNNEYAKFEGELTNLKLVKYESVCDSTKILGFVDPSLIKGKINILKEEYPSLEISISKPFFIEITKKDVNKANAIKELTNNLDIKYEECICFGDSENDLPMFNLDLKAKYAVANASQSIKDKSTEIVKSVDENGVAWQILELI